MTAIDWMVIFIGIFLIAFFTYQRLVKALFGLVVVWAATLSSSLLYEEAAFRTQAVTGGNPILAEGLLLVLLFVLFLVIGIVVVHVAFPVTKLPSIGVLDYGLGFLVAVLIAVLVGVFLLNAAGVMVREVWRDQRAWSQWSAMYYPSLLRPYAHQVLVVYRWAFAPFAGYYPPALIPQ